MFKNWGGGVLKNVAKITIINSENIFEENILEFEINRACEVHAKASDH